MKKLLIVLCLLPFVVQAQRMNVRVLSTMKVSSVNISVQRGNYQLFLDGVRQPDSLLTSVFQLTMVADSFEIRIPGDTLGKFASFYLQSTSDTCSFRIKPIVPMS
ncbi:MAG TPA: hypothetical protein VK826_14145, partial [Bacteroidia bacterium]|nr:hypothetical protein [Bacteroidia bacterium]